MTVKAAAVESRRLVHDAEGLNTGVWPAGYNDLVTSSGDFFTRSHATVPHIDPHTWRLEIGGLVEQPGSFSLEQLCARFPRQEITATMICAGLRRNEFLALGPLPGELPWGPEPASTGRWAGLLLRDVLAAAGPASEAQHVEFVGLDQVERHDQRFGFGGSIDLAKAMGDEVLLATELNGQPLSPAHGYPLRVVVPGWIGAKSVKWLKRITLLREPSSNYFQNKAYRLQRTINPDDPRDVSGGIELTEIPLNSVILYPSPDCVGRAGPIRARGWAIGAGGHPITRVELSSNGGRNWIPGLIVTRGEGWSWSLWEATLDLAPGRHTLVVRASDTTGVSQPPDVDATWNVKGYNNNAWHRVTIDLI